MSKLFSFLFYIILVVGVLAALLLVVGLVLWLMLTMWKNVFAILMAV